MATDFETDTRPSVTELVGGILDDAQKLARQQLTLFQVELKNDWRRTIQAAIPMAAGLVVCLVGVVIAAFALAHFLPTVWPDLPLWGSFALVSGALLLLGASATLLGRNRFLAMTPPVSETVQGLKENIQWKTNK